MRHRENTLDYLKQFKEEVQLINLSAYNLLTMNNPTYDIVELVKKKFPDIAKKVNEQ